MQLYPSGVGQVGRISTTLVFVNILAHFPHPEMLPWVSSGLHQRDCWPTFKEKSGKFLLIEKLYLGHFMIPFPQHRKIAQTNGVCREKFSRTQLCLCIQMLVCMRGVSALRACWHGDRFADTLSFPTLCVCLPVEMNICTGLLYKGYSDALYSLWCIEDGESVPSYKTTASISPLPFLYLALGTSLTSQISKYPGLLLNTIRVRQPHICTAAAKHA